MSWRSAALLIASASRYGRANALVPTASRIFQRTIATTTKLHATIQLRNATLDDLETVLAWDEKPHLKDPDVMGDEDYNEWDWEYELTRTELPWRYQLIAECDQKPIGVIQIIDPAQEESHYWGTDCPPNLRALDIWIGEEDYIGKGCGSQMMKLALDEYCFNDPAVEAAMVDPMANNLKAHRFYQKVGFVPEDIRYFGPDKCLVHRLSRQDYEQQLAKTQS